ncbi:MAG: CBS domain-containing protein [Desulfomonile sp.]|nr:CBS domain-containing protein [Desulfomonile sp.]
MTEKYIEACLPVDISDDDIYEAMREIPGYLDITPGDFKEVYLSAYRHAVLRLTRSVRVAEVMTKTVVSVTRKMPINLVAELMAEKKVSGIPVLENDGTVAGIISERDFMVTMGVGGAGTFMEVIATCLRGGSCLTAPLSERLAEDIMTSPPVTVKPETTLLEAANIMATRGINRLPVVDDMGHMVGIASRADVVRSSLVR